MSDSMSMLAGGDNQSAPKGAKRDGNVYVIDNEDGSKTYYPAKHADAGIWLPYENKEQADKANSMSLEEARKMHQEQSSSMQQAPNMAGQSMMDYNSAVSNPSLSAATQTAQLLNQQHAQKKKKRTSLLGA